MIHYTLFFCILIRFRHYRPTSDHAVATCFRYCETILLHLLLLAVHASCTSSKCASCTSPKFAIGCPEHREFLNATACFPHTPHLAGWKLFAPSPHLLLSRPQIFSTFFMEVPRSKFRIDYPSPNEIILSTTISQYFCRCAERHAHYLCFAILSTAKDPPTLPRILLPAPHPKPVAFPSYLFL